MIFLLLELTAALQGNLTWGNGVERKGLSSLSPSIVSLIKFAHPMWLLIKKKKSKVVLITDVMYHG